VVLFCALRGCVCYQRERERERERESPISEDLDNVRCAYESASSQ
jgi:hypothetical protein